MALYLRLFSDVHLDFDARERPNLTHEHVWSPEPLPTDSESILVLAGDLWYENRAFKPFLSSAKSWLQHVAERFEHVVFVLGNHDYWGLSLQSAVRKAREHVATLSNVTFLEKDSVVLSGVKFLGGTLWTDYGKDPIAMERIRREVKDYKYITFGESRVRRKVRPLDMLEVHRQTARYIFSNCHADEPGQPVVVVTHMAPAFESVDLREDRSLDFAYFTDLTKSIASNGKDIRLWVHGHMHAPVDYRLGNTRVLSNPRGYETYPEHTGYDKRHLLPLADI